MHLGRRSKTPTAEDPVAVGLSVTRGRPLEPETRRSLEGKFGQDLAHVRVHTDSSAERMVTRRGVGAIAEAGDIFFAPGRYAPHSRDGELLLAHEVAHVLQQRRPGGPPGADQEREAWAAARSVTRGRPAAVRLGSAAGVAQCGPKDPVGTAADESSLPTGQHSPDPREAQKIGSAGERHQFAEAEAALRREGFTEIHFRENFRGWLSEGLPD